jgi:hypothetical protein
MRCGTSCQPPHAGSCSNPSKGAPQGGGSGGGTAKPAGGKTNPNNNTASKLSQSMNRFGASITRLLSGGRPANKQNTLPGQAVCRSKAGMSPNSYLLVVLIVGGLLLFLAFGHKAVPG